MAWWLGLMAVGAIAAEDPLEAGARDTPWLIVEGYVGGAAHGLQAGRLQVGALLRSCESRLGLIAVLGQYHDRDENALWTDTARGGGLAIFLTDPEAFVSVKVDATVEMHRVHLISGRGMGRWDSPEPVLSPTVGLKLGPGVAAVRGELLPGLINPGLRPIVGFGYRLHAL